MSKSRKSMILDAKNSKKGKRKRKKARKKKSKSVYNSSQHVQHYKTF